MALGLRRKLSKKKLSLGKKDDISSKELVTNCETEAHRPSSSTPHCCGMANLGNTCYINSVVQALKHCPHLLDELQKNTRKSKEVNNLCAITAETINNSYLQISKWSDTLVDFITIVAHL